MDDCAASNSTHKAEVFVLDRVEPHPNADRLEVVRFAGYQTVVARGDFKPGQLAVFVPPDSVVDARREEFAFLTKKARSDGTVRIKAIKLRGVESFGLLLPAPAGASPGDDLAAQLGVTHYEPSLPSEDRPSLSTGAEAASAPDVPAPMYDLEAFRRYGCQCFTPGEPVYVSEKLDGTSTRYVFYNGKMHCGSRKEWKKEYPTYDHVSLQSLQAGGATKEVAAGILEQLHSRPKKQNLWWAILDQTPLLRLFCEANPGVVVYGEIYGNTNCIKYGLPEGNRFAAFDLLEDGRWHNITHCMYLTAAAGLPWVPWVAPLTFSYYHAYDFEALCKLAEGPTLVYQARPGTIREGIVISPAKERWNSRYGRAKLKLVSATFLQRYR